MLRLAERDGYIARTRMFPLHERTRKSLCRIGFVALCVLPTCAAALWAASRNGGGHRARCEADLSRLLRLQVTLGDVEYPEPGTVRYTDFLVVDPETDTVIASAAQLKVRTTDTVVAISASTLTIETNMATAVAELLHDRLRDRSEYGATPIRLAIGELLVADASCDVPLLDVGGRLEPTPEGRGAQLTFRTAAMAEDALPVVLTMVRSRDARIGVELFTQGAFEGTEGRFAPVVQLLRTLLANHEVLAPVPGEAEALIRASAQPSTP